MGEKEGEARKGSEGAGGGAEEARARGGEEGAEGRREDDLDAVRCVLGRSRGLGYRRSRVQAVREGVGPRDAQLVRQDQRRGARQVRAVKGVRHAGERPAPVLYSGRGGALEVSWRGA